MNLPDLGVGIVYWPPFRTLIESGLVSVIEVEPQGFWEETSAGVPICGPEFDDIRLLGMPVIVHGVGSPVGGTPTVGPRAAVTEALFSECVQTLEAAWASEHLSFNQADGPAGRFNTGFLLPPCQTEGGASVAVDHIRRTSQTIDVPFAVETGVSYLRPRPDELSDGQFVATVSEQANCGILLDLHNIWTNERNGRQSVERFLSEIPLERVWELHLAGGFAHDGYWLDAHSGRIPDALLALARELVPSLPNIHAVVFELIPQYLPSVGLDEVKNQLEALWKLWELKRTPPKPRRFGLKLEAPPFWNKIGVREWENALGGVVVGRGAGDYARELETDPGTKLFRKLSEEARAGVVIDALRFSCRLMLLARGAEFLRSLLIDFWATATPALFPSSEALAFAAHLRRRRPPISFLDEVLEFESAVLMARRDGRRRPVTFSCDPSALFAALERGSTPVVPHACCEVVVGPDSVSLE